MTRWIADYDVESHASLQESSGKITFVHPKGLYEVHISDRSISLGQSKQLLGVQIIFDAETIDAALEGSRDYLKSFLDLLELITGLSFKIDRIIKIIDWTPGLEMRDCHQFLIKSDPQIPFPILNDDVLKSIETILKSEIPITIRRALRWYALGVRATYSDEQFQYFWFALEQLAEFQKPTDEVADTCPRCKAELYCKRCDRISTHRPYPKQAIHDLILRRVKGEPERVFDILNEFRNGLMHGREIKEIENATKISLTKAVDALGRTVWAALISSLKAPEPYSPLKLIQPSTYAYRELVLKAILQVGSTKSDQNNPKIEDFGGTQISVDFFDAPPPRTK